MDCGRLSRKTLAMICQTARTEANHKYIYYFSVRAWRLGLETNIQAKYIRLYNRIRTIASNTRSKRIAVVGYLRNCATVKPESNSL